MTTTPNPLRAKYERDGWIRIPNVLQEMDALRYYMGMGGDGDWGDPQPSAIESPQIRARILSPAVLEIARDLLGPDLVYYGQSVVRYEREIGKNTLQAYDTPHQDAPLPMSRPFMVARFGIYLSDFTKGSGALRVWPGSHLGPMWPNAYKPEGSVDILSRPGDLVVWNLRTQHSAGYKGMPAPIEPRDSVIWDFGAPGADLEWYIKFRVASTAKRAVEMSRLGFDAEDVRAACEKAGVGLRTDILDAYREHMKRAA